MKSNPTTLLSLLALCLLLATACQSRTHSASPKPAAKATKAEQNYLLAPATQQDGIKVAITGQVPRPGYYTVTSEANLATVLVHSGWTPYYAKETYKSNSVILLKRLNNGKETSWVIDLDNLYNDEWMNFELKDGDIINVMVILF